MGGTSRWFQPGEGLHDCEMKERSTEKVKKVSHVCGVSLRVVTVAGLSVVVAGHGSEGRNWHQVATQSSHPLRGEGDTPPGAESWLYALSLLHNWSYSHSVLV